HHLKVFLQAAAIFQQLRREKPASHQLLQYEKKTDTLPISSGDKAAEQQAYQLAFNTLKCKTSLTEVRNLCKTIFILSSCSLPDGYGDLLPLAMVMLFDFQQRKFRLRQCPAEGDEVDIVFVYCISSRWKTKLAASLACFRIKHNLRSVSCVLSNSIRVKEHRAKSLPLYAWVNTLNTRYCMASGSHRSRSSKYSLFQSLSVLQPLLFEKGDVLVAGSFSALTLAHIAVAAAARSGQVLVCGADHTSLQNEEMKALLSKMDIKSEKLFSQFH
uniref:Uncharacterized protein n=1 Tax=Cyprinodon variegatus TaxID=28743 RepID=A0A3Q2DEL8_CYPVA